jgi:hypothetical protein
MSISNWILVFLTSAIVFGPVPSGAEDSLDRLRLERGWDHATARAYFRDHAQVQLGPEHRLPNGIAWRLHVDGISGMKEPRITWMPDAKRQRTANVLFEVVHADDLRVAAMMNEGREENWVDEGESLRRMWAERAGATPREGPARKINREESPLPGDRQADVALTYASVNLVSAVNVLGLPISRPFYYPHGITFDLARGTIHGVLPCDGSPGYGVVAQGGPVFLFRFGPLLRICDQSSYREFKRLYAERAAMAARTHALLIKESPESPINDDIKTCIDQYNDADKYPDRDYEFTLYLTAKGLAAHRSWFESALEMRDCTFVTPLNPTIIPWRDLAPLMQPGPWRDELLALH